MQYSIVMTPQEVDLVFNALGELPAKTTRNLMNSIEVQVSRQNESANEEAKKSIIEAEKVKEKEEKKEEKPTRKLREKKV